MGFFDPKNMCISTTKQKNNVIKNTGLVFLIAIFRWQMNIDNLLVLNYRIYE
jgi:hypothetical protein